MSSPKTKTLKQIKAIPIDEIRFLNPRVRNRRNFQERVQSIAKVGIKRPIPVSPRKTDTDSASYDLVCGQGRVEAFIQLGQTKIPAIVIEAEESDCLVRSLVENCARRQHRAIDLLADITTLRGRGYNDREIASKIRVTAEYVHMISKLLESGEERLVTAVEAGILPLNLPLKSQNRVMKTFSEP